MPVISTIMGAIKALKVQVNFLKKLPDIKRAITVDNAPIKIVTFPI